MRAVLSFLFGKLAPRSKGLNTLDLADTFLGAAGSFLFGKLAPVEYLGERPSKCAWAMEAGSVSM